LEPRVVPASDFFLVPPADTDGGAVNLRFEWGPSDARNQNEFGYYVVEDAEGRVNGLLPSDFGYSTLALERAQRALVHGSGFGAKTDVTVTGGQLLGVYLVSNGTTRGAQIHGQDVFFSFSAANADKFSHMRTRTRGDGGMDFFIEDKFGGGDQDFNDAVVSISRTQGITTPGTVGQTVAATFSRVSKDSRQNGEIGLYKVDAADGSVGGIAPGAAGYLQAVLGSAGRQTVFAAGLPDLTSQALTLDGGAQYAFYFRTGDDSAFFSFSDANADGLEHLNWITANRFGFEDTLGGGDRDYNDSVIEFTFGAPLGEPSSPADPTSPPVITPTPPTDDTPTLPPTVPPTLPPTVPPTLPPGATDTTPPVVGFRLNLDSGVSSTDAITNNATGVLTVTDDSGTIAGLRAGFDSTDPATYIDILSRRGANGTVTVDQSLQAILNNGNSLADGPHILYVVATDPSGNATPYQFPFTLDTTGAPDFNLDTASDTGVVGDLRTDAPIVTLTGRGAPAGILLQLSIPPVPGTPGTGTILDTATAAADGTFSFSNVGLAVGPNSYTVRAVGGTDLAGNSGGVLSQTFVRNTPPTVSTAIANQTAAVGGAALTFDLTNTFADAERIVRFATTYPDGQTGNLDFQVFANETPATVANFLQYVTGLSYNGTIFHRLAPGFVLQGGGFSYNAAGQSFTAVTKLPAVVNEPRVSNTLGTIAMAKLGGNPDSATNEFFFNLADNSANLDGQNGGFTVFGQVMNGGVQILNAIASNVTTFSGSGLPGAAPFPVSPTANTTNFPQSITTADLVNLTTASELTTAQRLTFQVDGNSAPTVANVVVSGSTLTVTPNLAGTTTISVRAIDLDGSVTTTSFTLTVTSPPPP